MPLYQGLKYWRSRPDSNRCTRRERAMSWASRRREQNYGGEHWNRTSRAIGAGFTVQCITIDASSPKLGGPDGNRTHPIPVTGGYSNR
jgi:hypothetical protein